MSKIKRRVKIDGAECWITANSEQEYAERLLKLSGAQPPKAAQPQEKHNFKLFAENWFNIYNKPNISTVAALTNYRQLRLYLYPAFEHLCVEDITSDNIQAMFNSMGDKAKASKHKAKNVLNMILDHAVDQKLIARNPLKSSSLRIAGKSSSKIPAYSVDEMKYFVSHINDVKNEQDRRWFAIMLFHPLRPEECLGLKYKDITSEGGNKYMHINGCVTHPQRSAPVYSEKLKTDLSRRILQIAPAAIQYIPDGEPEHFVIGGEKPLSYTMSRNMCGRIARDIGYEGMITPRRFRTTVASDLYAATHDEKLVQNSLGHSRHSATAMNHYIESRSSVDTTGSIIQSVYSAM